MSTDVLPGLDLPAVHRVLEPVVELAGPLRAQLISGGRSNLTFLLTDGVSRWVLRRPPLSGLTPSAHDMVREWTVTHALQGTAVPVPATVVLCEDADVLGAPFTVTGFVDGRVLRSRDDLVGLDGPELHRMAYHLVDVLAGLHQVDPAAVGLAGFGRPAGFLERQVNLWLRQWEKVKTRELPDVERLGTRLLDRVPRCAERSAIVHGDYRVDNTILDTTDIAQVRAVVDWEMATLGDPLTDLALMCVYRQPALDAILGIPAAWASDLLPTGSALAERYAATTGAPLDEWSTYLGLANLKLAVIAEGISHRALQGAAADATAASAREATATLISAGLREVA